MNGVKETPQEIPSLQDKVVKLEGVLARLILGCEASGVTQVPAGSQRPDLDHLARVLNEARLLVLGR